MARSRLNLSPAVKASSILEVIVGMIVIMAVFSIVIGIYVNILKQSISPARYRAEVLLLQIMDEAELSPWISEETTSQDGYLIRKKVSLYKKNPALRQVHVMLLDQSNTPLTELKKILYLP